MTDYTGEQLAGFIKFPKSYKSPDEVHRVNIHLINNGYDTYVTFKNGRHYIYTNTKVLNPDQYDI